MAVESREGGGECQSGVLYCAPMAACAAIPLLEIAPLAFFTALALTPITRAFARATGFVDHPDPRKAHARATPLLGGVAIAGALAAAPLLARAIASSSVTAPRPGLLAGALVALGLGLVDDRRPLGPAPKLLGQLLAAVCLIAWGTDVVPLRSNPLLAAAALVAVVALLNAVNFLDNLDGIVGTMLPVTAGGFVALALVHGATVDLALAWGLVGACAGFLLYNAPPARIFLGDAGSHLLGYALAALALQSLEGSFTWPHLAAVVALLAYPIFDLAFVVLDRTARRRPVHVGGVDHTTHRLAKLYGPWGALGVIAGLCFANAIAGVWLWSRSDPLSTVGTLGILALGYALFGVRLRHVSPTSTFVT